LALKIATCNQEEWPSCVEIYVRGEGFGGSAGRISGKVGVVPGQRIQKCTTESVVHFFDGLTQCHLQ
jgi:hypothetical protein